METRGRVVESENDILAEQTGVILAGQSGFATEDILWAIGIWSVIQTMSPVVVFYLLMVA